MIYKWHSGAKKNCGDQICAKKPGWQANRYQRWQATGIRRYGQTDCTN